jgi:hypothetical protein
MKLSYQFVWIERSNRRTVSEYVPAVGKLLGKENKKDEVEPTKPSGPPHRPVHDTQIEEFVRDQHRSQNIDGVMQ